jgi:hypothetical protein
MQLRHWLTFLVLLFSSGVYAEGFRLAEFGEACYVLSEREAKIGSEPIEWSLPGDEYRAFRVRAFGYALPVLYFCPAGRLFTGNVYFPLESLSKAKEKFYSVYLTLVALNGKPNLDNTPWGTGVDPRVVDTDGRKYNVVWRCQKNNASISIMPGLDDDDSTWLVFIVVGKSRYCKNA